MDPRKTTHSSGLYFPERLNHEKLHEGSGKIVRTNRADWKKLSTMRLEEGDRVAFRGYLKFPNRLEPTRYFSRYTDGVEMEWSFIAIDDLIMWLDPDVELGLLSESKKGK